MLQGTPPETLQGSPQEISNTMMIMIMMMRSYQTTPFELQAGWSPKVLSKASQRQLFELPAVCGPKCGALTNFDREVGNKIDGGIFDVSGCGDAFRSEFCFGVCVQLFRHEDLRGLLVVAEVTDFIGGATAEVMKSVSDGLRILPRESRHAYFRDTVDKFISALELGLRGMLGT
jgi:hypothetical protein